jgi:hypothetical protein
VAASTPVQCKSSISNAVSIAVTALYSQQVSRIETQSDVLVSAATTVVVLLLLLLSLQDDQLPIKGAV